MSDKNKNCKLNCNKWINNIKNKNYREIHDIELIEKIKNSFRISVLVTLYMLNKINEIKINTLSKL